MEEKTLHNLISSSRTIKDDIISYSGLNLNDNFDFYSEYRLENNMIVDFAVVSQNELVLLIELKGSNIGTNDLVRGIGQLYQYINLPKSRDIFSGLSVSANFKAVLILPESIFKNKIIESNFVFPDEGLVLAINEKNNALRVIDKELIDKLIVSPKENLKLISSYYLRDNRLFELYILLKLLDLHSILSIGHIKRGKLESEILKHIEVINNGNWRNAFISLSSLGFIDKNNHTTRVGNELARMKYEEFCYEIFKNYIEEYVIEIFKVLDFNKKESSIKNTQITAMIEKNNLSAIKFLTESKSRYISSWLNILRDDFGCIFFESGSSKRYLNYNILKYNKEAIINEIHNSSIGFKYINQAFDVIREKSSIYG
jgi:hypothetical protein